MEDWKSVPCPYCRVDIALLQLGAHLSSVHVSESWRCGFCNLQTNSREEIATHCFVQGHDASLLSKEEVSFQATLTRAQQFMESRAYGRAQHIMDRRTGWQSEPKPTSEKTHPIYAETIEQGSTRDEMFDSTCHPEPSPFTHLSVRPRFERSNDADLYSDGETKDEYESDEFEISEEQTVSNPMIGSVVETEPVYEAPMPINKGKKRIPTKLSVNKDQSSKRNAKSETSKIICLKCKGNLNISKANGFRVILCHLMTEKHGTQRSHPYQCSSCLHTGCNRADIQAHVKSHHGQEQEVRPVFIANLKTVLTDLKTSFPPNIATDRLHSQIERRLTLHMR